MLFGKWWTLGGSKGSPNSSAKVGETSSLSGRSGVAVLGGALLGEAFAFREKSLCLTNISPEKASLSR